MRTHAEEKYMEISKKNAWECVGFVEWRMCYSSNKFVFYNIYTLFTLILFN